jgi:hypothetical protein
MPSKKKEEEAIIVAPPSGIMTAMPDYLLDAAPLPGEVAPGAENVEQEDFLMPRLALCGKQSPQYDENNEKYMEDLELGQFFNSITREIYGSEIYIVPLMEVKTRAKMPPYGSKEPIACRSTNGKLGVGDPGGDCHTCPHAQFTANGTKRVRPACTKFYSFVTLVMPSGKVDPKTQSWNVRPRLETMTLLSFKSTSESQGQQLISMLNFRRRPWYACVMKIRSAPMSDGKNSWYIPIPDNAGWLSQEGAELSKPAYESIRELFATGRVHVEEEPREPGMEP